MISSDEAFLLLKKWKEEKHPLKLLLAGEGFRMSFSGVVEEISGARVAFFPVEPNACIGEAWLELANSTFEYGDSRTAEPSFALKFTSLLTVIRPDRTVFIFAERTD